MTNNHLTEEQLETFATSPEKISEPELKRIQFHLSRCELCKEHLQGIQAFYNDLREKLQGEPSEKDKQLAQSLLRKRGAPLLPFRSSESLIESYAETIETSRTFPQRVFDYAKLHPIRFAGATSAVAAVIVLAVLLIRPTKNVNPSYAGVKNHVLFIYNKHGEVLWQKNAVGLPDGSTREFFQNQNTWHTLVLVDDIDGDKQNEILLRGTANNIRDHTFSIDSLYCFESNGALRWIRAYPANVFAADFDYTRYGKWNISTFFTLWKKKPQKPRLYVALYAAPYYPAKIIEVNPANGAELQTYWHPGGIVAALPHDIDGDKNPEIVAIGANNGYRRGYILALDPDHLEGCGPTPPEFYPTGVPKGKEKYYMLFPRTDISERFSGSPYNSPQGVSKTYNGDLIIPIEEFLHSPPELSGQILYTLGYNFKILVVTWSDMFLKAYEKLLSEGKVKKPLSPEYWENLKKGALYWDGEKFVKEPTMNKLYAKNKSPL